MDVLLKPLNVSRLFTVDTWLGVIVHAKPFKITLYGETGIFTLEGETGEVILQ